uniref:Uncharacterized protein n=1 Tax=Caenorhabditis japonica TaxID=281687 RepID=A0A8R1E2M0_CAEJA
MWPQHFGYRRPIKIVEIPSEIQENRYERNLVFGALFPHLRDDLNVVCTSSSTPESCLRFFKNDHQTPIPTSFERYNSEEERMSPRVTTTTTAPVEQLQRVPERKIHAEKQAFQKSKPVQLTVPEEAELDIILGDLMKNDNMKMKMDKSKLPRVGKRGSKRHVGGVAPKVISFDGTALVDKRHAKASPVSVKFHPRKLYRSSPTNTQNQGPDFDPWERMGQ